MKKTTLLVVTVLATFTSVVYAHGEKRVMRDPTPEEIAQCEAVNSGSENQPDCRAQVPARVAAEAKAKKQHLKVSSLVMHTARYHNGEQTALRNH